MIDFDKLKNGIYYNDRLYKPCYTDNLSIIYNEDCNIISTSTVKFDFIFADPDYSDDLFNYANVFNKCCGHLFIMSSERNLIKYSYANIDKFVRMYAVNTVIPNLISNKAPMQLADFISEFRFTKTKFENKNECFSNLIEAKKIRMKRQYSQNFDKQQSLFAYFLNHFTKENNLCLDPFSGSGSCLIASRKLNRKCVAFELNPKSCNNIINKIRERDLFIDV